MVREERREQQGQINDRPGNRLARDEVAVALMDQPGMAQEHGVKHGGDCKVEQPAHADHPWQPNLAAQRDVDLTTITRAYDEARRRNLLEGRSARGTYVAAPKVELTSVLDLSMNTPPPPMWTSTTS